MKVIIQIPCYNEEETLPITLADLPRELKGVDEVKWLIINDGSEDNTVQTAIDHGVDYVISHVKNLGLAQGFLSGINASVQLGADIIVNTDADNQYCADDIQKLIDPILDSKAEFVVGTRPIQNIEHFSPLKKMLQKLGSWVVRQVSQTTVEDAPSGFRAITRNAAIHLHVFNKYTYTLETVIQAGHMNLPTVSVPIRTNDDLRASRLISSIPKYLSKSFSTIVRSFITYEPLRFFVGPAILSFFIAVVLGIRYLFFYFGGEGSGHVQSLLLAMVLVILGVALFVIGLLADLISVNRKLLENIDTRLRVLQADFSEQFPNTVHPRVFSRGYLVYSRKDQDNLNNGTYLK